MSDLQVNPATIEFLKQEKARRGKRRAITSLVGLLLVAGIASAGYFGWNSHRKAAADALAHQLASTPDGRDKLRAAVQSGELTREQAWDAGRAEFEKRQQEVMDGFFKTPVANRDKYLDNIIDEMQKRRAEWEKNRPTTAPTTRPDWPRPNNGPTSRPTDAQRQAQQRARADNQSPLQRAQQSEFRAAMRARMAARGMNGGGGRGPGGGGWGGAGGGGGGRGGRG